MAEIARYTFHIASNQRNSGTNTDMNISLSQIITRLALKSQLQVIIHGITIPFSFYQLSSDIATLGVSVFGYSPDGTITLTPGNYTTVSILTELSSKLTAYCAALSPTFTPTFTFTYSTTTGKTTLVSNSTRSITLKFASNTNLGLFFGFSADATFTLTSTTGDKVAVANPVTYLLLRSPSLRQFKNREWVVEKDTFSDILYRIPISTNVGTYIQWYGDSERVVLVNDTLSLLNFYLTTNLSYTPIDLQGLPFSFHMTIIEMLQPDYVPITNSTLVNKAAEPPTNTNEIDRLQRERDDALRRLEVYKKKLTPKENVLLQRNGEPRSNPQQEAS